MIKKFAAGLLMLGSFAFGLFGADQPFAGTWKLNVAKSKFAKGHEYKDLTVNAKYEGDTAMVTAKGMDGAGKAISVKYSVPVAGGPVTYTEGAPAAGATVVSKRVDAHTVEQTTTMDGKPVVSFRSVVSANGKTLSQTRTYLDKSGKSSKSVLVYDHQ